MEARPFCFITGPLERSLPLSVSEDHVCCMCSHCTLAPLRGIVFNDCLALPTPSTADSIENGSGPREEIGERLPASNFPDPEDREQVARSELLQNLFCA